MFFKNIYKYYFFFGKVYLLFKLVFVKRWGEIFRYYKIEYLKRY